MQDPCSLVTLVSAPHAALITFISPRGQWVLGLTGGPGLPAGGPSWALIGEQPDLFSLLHTTLPLSMVPVPEISNKNLTMPDPLGEAKGCLQRAGHLTEVTEQA